MIIREKILDPMVISNDQILENVYSYLSSKGYSLKQSNNLLRFRGHHSVPYGMNTRQLIKPILKGNVYVNNEEGQKYLIWRLKIDAVIVRTVLLGGLVYFVLGRYIPHEFVLRISISVFLGLILGAFSLYSIFERIKMVSEEIDIM